MNKKFSTLVAALFAAGALVLPTDLFAQLQYSNGQDYAGQTNGTLPTKTGKTQSFYLTFEENGIDYVAYVDQYALKSIPLLHATEDQKVTIKKTSNGYTLATGSSLLGSAWGYDGFGDNGTTVISNIKVNADGTITIEYGTRCYVNRAGTDWDSRSGLDATIDAKLVAANKVQEIAPARDIVTGDIDFSKPYVIMAAGQVLDADKEGEASFAYVGKQSTYWTLEKHETTATAGYALLKNKETGKYMTIGGDEVAIKLTKNGDKWEFAETTDGFQLYVITDWYTAKAVEMDGVDMTSFQLGEAYENVPVTASELSKIFGSSFNVELKKGNDALLDNPFSGNIKPVALEVVNGKYTDKIVAPTSSTDYFLQKANGNIIAVQVNKKYADATATYGYAVVEVSAHDLALALNGDKVDGKEYVYAPFFTIYASEDFAAGIDTDVDYIIAIDKDNNEYRLGSLNYGGNDGKPTLSAENGNVLTYLDPITVKIGAFNTVDVKKLLASPAFFTLTNKNTKKTYSNNYGKVLGLSQDGSVDWVEADEALVGYPETEWAITYDSETKVLTFKNRENPKAVEYYTQDPVTKDIVPVYFTIHESQLYNIDGKTNVFAYQGDTIEFKANTQYKESDGYLRLDAQKLRDQLYYVGISSSVWDGTAYVTENHLDNHQLGLDIDQEDATKWNLAAAWYTERNSLNEVVESRPDTILIGSTMTYWDAAHNTFTTTDKDGKQTVFLKIMAFSLQNEDNGEYMGYRRSDTRYTTGNEYGGYTSGLYFAFKDNGDEKYNMIETLGSMGNRYINYYINTEDEFNYGHSNKVYGGDSADKGILNATGMYKQTENDLFVIEETDAPEYLKLSQGDTIRIFRDEFDSNVLYEKGEFAGINNAVEFDEINPALYVDTAYVNRPGNNRWEYLLAVDVNRIDTTYKCNVPAHGIHRMDTTYGRFLVNLADSAIVEDERDVHVNKYVYEGSYGARYARLGFVDGMHTSDTLVIASSGDSIEVGTPDPQLVKFAFRVVDHETESFVIETGYKYPYEGNKISDYRGYLAYINGNLVVVDEIEDAEVFRLNADETRTPTANEEISAEEATVSVVATNGAVIVKGAEGKNVVVSTILGKVVANEVLNSDNETIAAPAGIVVVSVDGESFKVAVK